MAVCGIFPAEFCKVDGVQQTVGDRNRSALREGEMTNVAVFWRRTFGGESDTTLIGSDHFETQGTFY
jgi:hypothetical protein